MTLQFPGIVYPTSGQKLRTINNLLNCRRMTGGLSFALTADQEDWNETGFDDLLVKAFVTLDDDHTIGGIQNGAAHKNFIIINDDETYSLTLKDESEDSDAENRLSLGGSNVVLNPGEGAALWYDSIAQRFICYAVAVPYPLANDPGEPGLPGLNWRHQWIVSPATAYEENDGVFNEGQSYIAIANHTSSSLTEPGVGANWETVWDLIAAKGTDGAGSVDSVNGQAGTVVLDADDIDDTSTTNKFTTASDISKLAGIEAAADVTDTTNVAAAGAFMKSADDADDITEGASHLFLTSAERSAISGLASTYQPLDSDLTAIAALSPTNDDIVQRKAGAWTNRSMAQLATDLGLGNAATKNTGTSAGTVAAGDDSRITGAFPASRITISTSSPSGGNNDDIWFKVSS